MDKLNAFFSSGPGGAQFVQLEGPSPRPALFDDSSDASLRRTPSPPRPQGTGYAARVRHREREQQMNSAMNRMFANEDFTDDDPPGECDIAFEKFNFKMASRTKFPIDRMKTEILNNISSEPVTIVEGPTGCGKTTQIPQWILESCCNKKVKCNIIVTQPRRIAAVCVAKRVCDENHLRLGDLIGYQIGLDRRTSADTRLTYVTAGVLLRQLIVAKSLRHYTHIILDEVHERGKDMDFLLLIIRKLLKTNSMGIKVILMSATFNIEKFAEYFAIPTCYGFQNNSVISLSDSSVYPVAVYYLENLSKLGEVPTIAYETPTISKEGYNLALKLINAFEQIDTREESDKDVEDQRPCILIFLPGLGQIEDLFNILSTDTLRQKIDPRAPLHKWWIVPLHSTITTEEQRKAFKRPPKGYRKIILATDIAESSITVPDIKYVIDFCLNKMLVCNPNTNFSSLQLNWASKTNCKQRAGRAGRVRVGRVYRLVPSDFYETLPEECLPEMQRCSLESLVLSSKLLEMGSPKYLLALAMDPPDLTNIHQTVLVLKEIGGLYKTLDGVISHDDGDITYLGRIMANLPIDVKITKLIVLGYIFGCMEDCIIIGAALSTRNIFSNPFLEKMSAFNSKLTWAYGSTSDCLSYLNVYRVYESFVQHNHFSTMDGGYSAWAKSMFLQGHALKEFIKLVEELKQRLEREGITLDKESHTNWTQTEIVIILKILLAGAFYPHFFGVSTQFENEEREAAKILNGKDPCNTVYLANMDNRHPGILYSSQIKNMFKDCSAKDVDVDFDNSSKKIYVTFPSDIEKEGRAKIPGKVALSVYQAIKMRQLKLPLNLNVMPLQKSLLRAAELGIDNDSKSSVLNLFNKPSLEKVPSMHTRLPGIDESYINITISSMVNCGKFWARIADETTTQEMIWLDTTLNRKNNVTALKSEPIVGRMYAAEYQETINRISYSRARVEKVLPNNSVWVLFIDYGNAMHIPIPALRDFAAHSQKILNMRPMAFECILSEIGPSFIRNPRGLWTERANKVFSELTHGKILHGKIFSVVNSVVALELIDGDLNINDYLLKQGHAQIVEESYASKLNRDLRNRVCDMQTSEIHAHNETQSLQNLKKYFKILAPTKNECTNQIRLKGPFSPLETKVYGLFNAGRNKSIHIEWDSVNSVLLNTEAQNSNETLLVATNIHETVDGSSFTIRNTTLMPNIPGLTALISLIFCPVANLHCDITNNRYNGILCGLGHINGDAMFPEHDMFVNINVDINNDDLEDINFLRVLLNRNLTTSFVEELSHGNSSTRTTTPKAIKEIIKKLLLRKRKQHEYSPVTDCWYWEKGGEMLEPASKYSENVIFPPHFGTSLKPYSNEAMVNLAKENIKLHNYSKGTAVSCNQSFQCLLCGTGMMSLQSLRLHLHSRMHRDNEIGLPKINTRELCD